MIMILLYGAGGEPGRGEIPMRWFRKPSLSDFPIRGCLVFGFSGKIQILGPENVKEEYKKMVMDTAKIID